MAGSDGYSAFFPNPLPPSPPIDLDGERAVLLDEANHALGKLDGITLALWEPEFLIYTFARKEALLSSQIEGTQSTLSELLLFENDASPGVPIDDVRQPSNYLAALEFGMKSIRQGPLPVSARLIREMHGILLNGTRGSDKQPGEFRTSQNWIGGSGPGDAIYVPPPHYEVQSSVAQLERFIHDEDEPSRTLIKAALAHTQFESIHPFLDGNGRIGRLLVTLLLCDARLLDRPMLYMSLYLKQNRTQYYELLQSVRTEGAYEEWVEFFLRGVIEVSTSVIAATKALIELTTSDRQRIAALGRGAASAARVYELLPQSLAIRAPQVAKRLGVSEPTVNSAIAKLVELGILVEITGKTRNRVYGYMAYVRLVNDGITDPPG